MFHHIHPSLTVICVLYVSLTRDVTRRVRRGCVVSAVPAAGAANPLTTCSQQQATLAREVSMPMTLATAFPFVWCAGLGIAPWPEPSS